MIIPVILLVGSCKTAQFTHPDDDSGRKIIIGEGGGFTGQTTKVILLENGQYFSQTVYPQGTTAIGTLKRKDTREIFERFDELNFTEIDFQHPGNMTYFIGHQSEGAYHEVKWGDSSFPPPEKITSFYQFFRSKVQ